MIKPDVIVTWAKHIDFPLWRQFIRDNRFRFEKVIIVFMESNHGHDYRPFIRQAMEQDNCLFLDEPPRPAHEDWRNNCINFALPFSNAEWIWFTEQDFYPQNNFWKNFGLIQPTDGYCGVKVADRLHPCCLLVRRDVLNATSRDFSARPALGYDHFGRIQTDLELLPVQANFWDESDWLHYNGMTQNFTMMCDGLRPNYRERDFLDYLAKCLNVRVQLDPVFMNEVRNYFAKVTPEYELLI